MELADISSTAEVRIPSDPLLQVIGQENAVKFLVTIVLHDVHVFSMLFQTPFK